MTQPALEDPSGTSTLAMFEILKSATADVGAARLGRLALANRRVMETPNYLAVASRGVIPHLTPENMERYTEFDAAYMAIEDCM